MTPDESSAAFVCAICTHIVAFCAGMVLAFYWACVWSGWVDERPQRPRDPWPEGEGVPVMFTGEGGIKGLEE